MALPGEGAIKAKDSAYFAAQFRAPERIAAAGTNAFAPTKSEKRSAISTAPPGEGAIKAKDSACFAAQVALFRALERIAAADTNAFAPTKSEKRSAISMASPGEGAIKAKDSACFAAQFRAPERIAANARQIDGRQIAPFIIHFRHAVLSVCFDMFS